MEINYIQPIGQKAYPYIYSNANYVNDEGLM
jgi:hypothetical protein